MNKYSIGIDLGGTKILAGIIDKNTGEVIATIKKRTKKDKGQDVILERIIKTINIVLDENNVELSEIESIGIGAAGQIDRKNGILLSAPNLKCTNLNLKKELKNAFKKPVYVGNDVEVATLGELKFGSGKGVNNFVCVFVGTGIGAGIVQDGKLYHGSTGTAGEIGHMVVSPGGRSCGCGGHGCLEAHASRTAIERKIQGSLKKGHKSLISELVDDKKIIKSSHIKQAVDAKDELVTNCLVEASEYLSSGLASVVNFYNPELIILGGGLISAVEFFYEITVNKTIKKCLPVPAQNIKTAKAYLDDNAGIIGAAMLKEYRDNL